MGNTTLTKLTFFSSLLWLLGACGAPSADKPVDSGSTVDSTGTPGSDAAIGSDGSTVDSSPDANDECVEAVYEAEQEPLSLMVVLDRSASMLNGNKFTYAAQAIVQALDQDVFDSVALGLYSAPSGTITGPECIFGISVACAVPPFPQVDLAIAGPEKSNAASGVRRQIKTWLSNNAPSSGGLFEADGTPLYDALNAAIGSISGFGTEGKRALLVVTDGSISCAQFSSRAGYADCNGCDHDWENPDNLVELVTMANANATTPIQTFVMGVPGADTYDSSGCMYPPYRMRLALSAIGYAGAPGFASPTCDGVAYSQTGANPSESCHFDMTQGTFSTQTVADKISYIRGETVGCVYDLPEPPTGSEIDLERVNVEYTIDGQITMLGKRADPSNECIDEGCWDYTDTNQVKLIGKACTDVKSASSVNVRIITGCLTIIL